MIKNINTLKGIHPGLFLDHILKKRKIKKVDLAKAVGEHPQTIGAIIKGKRRMNTKLALKIEKLLDIEEGLLMILQIFYDILLLKNKDKKISHPNLSRIRSVLFWDTDIKAIDWEKQKRAVIKRVFERGNKMEKDEIVRFYGENTVNKILKEYENATL